MTALSEDDIVLAGEAALGVLDPATRATVAARIATDAAFAREVAAWDERFEPLLGALPSPAPQTLWDSINSAIRPVVGARAANRALRLWQGIAATATAAAAVFAVMLYDRPTATLPAASAPLLVAALGSGSEPSAVAASYDRARGELVLTPLSLDGGSRFPELWIIPAGGKAHSLGIIQSARPSRVRVDPALGIFLARGATLAVTLEPEGGAPGGKASGPVVASGKITIL